MNCESLKNVDFSDGLLSIDKSAFSGCSALESVALPFGVSEIEEESFKNCKGLTKLGLPESVTSIGKNAFFGCEALTFVYLPDTIVSLGESSFEGCASLKHVRLSERLQTVPTRCFFGNESLCSVHIPDSVTEIGPSAFRYCSNITELVLGRNVQVISDSAFWSEKKLHTLVLPDNLKSEGLSDYAFYGGGSIDVVRFGDGMEAVPNSLFQFTDVRVIILGKNTKTIGISSFEGCGSLEKLIAQTPIVEDKFMSFPTNHNCTLYYTGSEADWNANAFHGEEGFLQNHEGIPVRYNFDLASDVDYQKVSGDALKNDTAYIALSVDKKVSELAVGDSMEVTFSVIRNNRIIKEKYPEPYYSSNDRVISVSATDFADGVYTLHITGRESGITRFCVTDPETGAYESFLIRVGCPPQVSEQVNNVLTFDLAHPPVLTNLSYFDGGVWNCGASDIDIVDLTCEADNLQADAFRVSFRAYNGNYCNAAADVYDADGNWIDAVRIDKFQRETDLLDVAESLAQGLRRLNCKQCTDVSFTVPKGGSFTVSIDINKSRGAWMYNSLDVVLNSLGAVKDVLSVEAVDEDTLKETLRKMLSVKELRSLLEDEATDACKAILMESAGILYGAEFRKEFSSEAISFWDALSRHIRDDYADTVGETLSNAALDLFWQISRNFVHKAEILDLIFAGTSLFDALFQWQALENSVDSACLTFFAPQRAEDLYVNNLWLSGNCFKDDGVVPQVFEIVSPKNKAALPSAAEAGAGYHSGKLYSICMIRDEKIVQPDGKVLIRIPAPEDLDSAAFAVYRRGDDHAPGQWVKLDARLENGYVVFETDHCCYFELRYDALREGKVLIGDVNGDGVATAADARLALRAAVGLETYEPGAAGFLAADYDRSGSITAADARAILRLAVGLAPLA